MLIGKILVLGLVGLLIAAVLSSRAGEFADLNVKLTKQRQIQLFDALNVYFSAHCTSSPNVLGAVDLTPTLVNTQLVPSTLMDESLGVFSSNISIGTPSFLFVTLTLHNAPTQFLINNLAPTSISGQVFSWRQRPQQGGEVAGITEELIVFKEIYEPRCP